MVLKIDLEKGFHKLEWSFIKDTHKFFGFPPKLSKLILSCISTSSIVVLVNSRKTSFFNPSRGIRQGDSISSYIFIMCIERLSRGIEIEVKSKNWNPVSISHGGPKLSHLFFANDLTLIARVSAQKCHSIVNFLTIFSKLSG